MEDIKKQILKHDIYQKQYLNSTDYFKGLYRVYTLKLGLNIFINQYIQRGLDLILPKFYNNSKYLRYGEHIYPTHSILSNKLSNTLQLSKPSLLLLKFNLYRYTDGYLKRLKDNFSRQLVYIDSDKDSDKLYNYIPSSNIDIKLDDSIKLYGHDFFNAYTSTLPIYGSYNTNKLIEGNIKKYNKDYSGSIKLTYEDNKDKHFISIVLYVYNSSGRNDDDDRYKLRVEYKKYNDDIWDEIKNQQKTPKYEYTPTISINDTNISGSYLKGYSISYDANWNESKAIGNPVSIHYQLGLSISANVLFTVNLELCIVVDTNFDNTKKQYNNLKTTLHELSLPSLNLDKYQQLQYTTVYCIVVNNNFEDGNYQTSSNTNFNNMKDQYNNLKTTLHELSLPSLKLDKYQQSRLTTVYIPFISKTLSGFVTSLNISPLLFKNDYKNNYIPDLVNVSIGMTLTGDPYNK